MNDNSYLKANCFIELYSSNNEKTDYRYIHNAVMQKGKADIANRLSTNVTAPTMGWMELGTGSYTTSLLGSYIAGSRVAFTTLTQTSAVLTAVGDWAAGTGTGAITEAGTFNVETENTGTMWMASSFAVINKTTGDSLRITWTLTIS